MTLLSSWLPHLHVHFRGQGESRCNAHLHQFYDLHSQKPKAQECLGSAALQVMDTYSNFTKYTIKEQRFQHDADISAG